MVTASSRSLETIKPFRKYRVVAADQPHAVRYARRRRARPAPERPTFVTMTGLPLSAAAASGAEEFYRTQRVATQPLDVKQAGSIASARHRWTIVAKCGCRDHIRAGARIDVS